MKYTHLSQDERYRIEAMHRDGCDSAHIAQRLGRARSTVYRELVRNGSPVFGLLPSAHGARARCYQSTEQS